MTTSNNTTFELTGDQIINAAYRKVGFLFEGQALSTEALTIGRQALNTAIMMLQTDGMPLWKRTTVSFAPSTTSQVYTCPAGLKVAQVYLAFTGGTQYDLIEKSLYDFNRLPSNNPATPVHYTAQKTLNDYTVSIWPATSDTGTVGTCTINVVYQKEFDGFFGSTDTPDFPQYWTLPLIYQTAVILAPETGLPLPDRQQLMKEAMMYIDKADGYGDEDGSLFLQVDYLGHKD